MRPLFAFLALSALASCTPPVEEVVGKLEADVKGIREWSEPFLGHYTIDETTSIEEV